MNGLEVLRMVLTSRQTSGRAVQVESGASNAGECRAASLLRLTGVPKSDPDLDVGLPSTWGSGIHLLIEQAIKASHPDLISERRLTYRGVPTTIDLILPGRVVDWKGVEKGALADLIRENRPKSEGHRMQVHLGAAAAIEAGHEITDVSVVYIPRDARTLDDCWEFTEPFDRAIANASVEDLAARDAMARDLLADLAGGGDTVTTEGIVANLGEIRDEMPGFCFSYCPWVSVCRGEGEPDTADPNPQLLDAAQRYVIAKLEADEALARKEYYRDMLRGAPPVVTDGWKVAWSRDTRETVVEEVVDVDAMTEAYTFVIGTPPTKTVERTTGKAASLTPRKVRK